MKKLSFVFILLCSIACNQVSEIEECGKHFQAHQDLKSLKCVVELLPSTADTSLVKKLLGTPIDMGFDYRYLIDSTSVNGCAVGAVFHINDAGKIDQKWIDEICE
ncbi:MAG: hypothetical protein ACPGJS_12215 [Flammeovirgaceae bacterium]